MVEHAPDRNGRCIRRIAIPRASLGLHRDSPRDDFRRAARLSSIEFLPSIAALPGMPVEM